MADITFQIKFLTDKTNTMANNLADLSAQVDDLQTSLDAKQEQIQTALDGLEATIVDLQAQIAAGANDPAAIQAISDKITAIKTDLESTPVTPTQPEA